MDDGNYNSLKAHSHGAIFSECDCVFFISHGMGLMDVNYTVHTVRLQFDLKMLSHIGKIAPCERTLICTVRVSCIKYCACQSKRMQKRKRSNIKEKKPLSPSLLVGVTKPLGSFNTKQKRNQSFRLFVISVELNYILIVVIC